MHVSLLEAHGKSHRFKSQNALASTARPKLLRIQVAACRMFIHWGPLLSVHFYPKNLSSATNPMITLGMKRPGKFDLFLTLKHLK